jgi:hypothetical protein
MQYRIVQYIQPWEIDDFERQTHVMILSSFNIDSTDDIIWDVTLNASDSIVNWQNSTISKKYIIDKFNYLRGLVAQYYTVEFDTDESIQGCTDKRRSCRHKQSDYIIWLDSDIYFSKSTLPYLINATKMIEDDFFMISPQIIKYWDDSWDVIVNERYLQQPHNHRDFFDSYSIDTEIEKNDISIKLNTNHIKFGGGWFNLFKRDIFDQIPLVDELGSYASDDTYLMLCSRKIDMKQYILTGIIVSEIGARFLHGKEYLKSNFDIILKDRNRISDTHFNTLVNNFYQYK